MGQMHLSSFTLPSPNFPAGGDLCHGLVSADVIGSTCYLPRLLVAYLYLYPGQLNSSQSNCIAMLRMPHYVLFSSRSSKRTHLTDCTYSYVHTAYLACLVRYPTYVTPRFVVPCHCLGIAFVLLLVALCSRYFCSGEQDYTALET